MDSSILLRAVLWPTKLVELLFTVPTLINGEGNFLALFHDDGELVQPLVLANYGALAHNNRKNALLCFIVFPFDVNPTPISLSKFARVSKSAIIFLLPVFHSWRTQSGTFKSTRLALGTHIRWMRIFAAARSRICKGKNWKWMWQQERNETIKQNNNNDNSFAARARTMHPACRSVNVSFLAPSALESFLTAPSFDGTTLSAGVAGVAAPVVGDCCGVSTGWTCWLRTGVGTGCWTGVGTSLSLFVFSSCLGCGLKLVQLWYLLKTWHSASSASKSMILRWPDAAWSSSSVAS